MACGCRAFFLPRGGCFFAAQKKSRRAEPLGAERRAECAIVLCSWFGVAAGCGKGLAPLRQGFERGWRGAKIGSAIFVTCPVVVGAIAAPGAHRRQGYGGQASRARLREPYPKLRIGAGERKEDCRR